MRQDHLRSAAEVLELDGYLGRIRMPFGHSHVRRRDNIAAVVGHGLGVDEPLRGDDLAVLAGEPHLHDAVRSLHLHTDKATATDAYVHPRGRDRGAAGSVPLLEVFSLSPHLPDEIDGSLEETLDHNRARIALISHRAHRFLPRCFKSRM